MKIRAYRPSDCKPMLELFYRTVHTVNAADYTKKQLSVWADGKADEAAWNHSFLAHTTFIAEENGIITGFADMDENGYLDRLYVHKDYQRQGIASALCSALENKVQSEKYTTHASVTARPFFEKRGYRVIRKQHVLRQGIALTNFIIEK